ncbi:MAG: hypothetical protein RSE41_08855 [Clostridia bacterium]
MPKISFTMKRDIIIIVIGYLLIDILVIGAFFVTVTNLENPDLFLILQNLLPNITNPLNTIKGIILSGSDFILFLKLSWYFFILILVFSIIYYFKNKDKYDFQGIEHGSSEWSKNGEEFNKLSDGTEILNKKNGFIISRKHFIGTDQRKVKINKNILVVGRIRIW